MSDRSVMLREVNRQDLATLCDVSLPVIDKWLSQGCPYLSRGSKGTPWRFDVAKVIAWRIERRSSEVAAAYTGEGEIVSREESDRRRALALAIVAELDADERLGKTVDRDEILVDVAAFCGLLHNGLGNAAGRIASRASAMSSAAEIEDIAKAEMNRAFDAAEAELATRWASASRSTGEG